MYTERYIGSRIKERRTKIGLTQKELAAKINEGIDPDDAPHTQISDWENGNKVPGTVTLTRLCNALDCDIEYLLGAIDAPHRTTHDVMAQTGLSEDAVTRLQQINETNPLGQGINRNNVMVPILGIISEFIEADALFQITNNVGFYLLYRELSKEPISATTEEEYEIAHSYTQKIGSEIISRKDLCEMYLQAAADYFKEMVKAIPIETERD